MTTFQRGLIEKKIQEMEPGCFQELALRFLPLCDSKYVGIIRNGQNEFGKPRPGVPDLIKILDSGEQIGCECGTEKDYWIPPADSKNFPKWKPIEDAEKCLERMVRPIEIILASNRPIPPKHPNVKTLIIDHLSKQSSCLVKPLSSADISSWIEGNLKKDEVCELAIEYFPEAVKTEKLQMEKATLESAIYHAGKLGFPIKDILQIIKSSGITDADVLEQRIVTEIFGNEKRFSMELSGTFTGIKRCQSRLPILSKPLGRVIQLLGAPKIGKTYLCWELIDINQFDYKWFSVPSDERQLSDFVNVFVISLYSLYWPQDEVVRWVKGYLRSSLDFGNVNTVVPHIFVIDNAHLLSANHLKFINDSIKYLKSNNLISSLGIIFVTNKNLNTELSVLDDTAVAPPWNKEEIEELIKFRGIKVADTSPTEYFKLLASQSGGHPLFAVSLAVRYSDRKGLVLNTIRSPGYKDTDLSKEIKTVLYQDILTSIDKQNFVQRLSLFTSKADLSVLEALRLDVAPQISTSVPTLVEEIGPAVLDGTTKDGLRISATFRDIAKERITPSEIRSVYYAAAKVLLKKEGKTIFVEKYLDGIFYLSLCGEIGQAATHVLFLFYGIQKEISDKEIHLKYILDRLFFFKFLDSTTKGIDYINLCTLKLMLGHYHIRLKEYNDAGEYLDQLNIGELDKVEVDQTEIMKMKRYLYQGVLGTRLVNLKYVNDPSTAVIQFLDATEIIKDEPYMLELSKILPEIVWRLPDEKLENFDFEGLSERLYQGRMHDLANVAIKIGFKASKNPSLYEALQKIAKEVNPAVKLFSLLSQSSICSQTGKGREARRLANEVEEFLKNQGKDPKELGSVYYQHLGDILYELGEMNRAIIAFTKSTSLGREGDDFIWGWNKFKIGLSSNDNKEIEENLNAATEHFINIDDYRNASRAKGALAAHFIRTKSYDKAIEIALQLAEWFYEEKKSVVGPAIRLLSAHIVKITHELTGKPLPAPQDNFPDIDPRLYLTVLDSLRPETGGVTTYQVISQLAKETGFRDQELRILKKAIYSDVIGNIDRAVLALNWHNIFMLLEPEEVDEHEVALLFNKMIRFQPTPGTIEEKMFLLFIFRPLTERTKENPTIWAPILLKILELIRQLLNGLDSSLSDRWEASLYYSEGFAKFNLDRKSDAYPILRKATKLCIKDQNWDLGIDAGFIATFNLGDRHLSLYEAGLSQYELFRCIEGKGLTSDIIRDFGKNIFRYWSRISWRKLAVSDLKVNEFLFKSAQILQKEGFKEDDAAPILVTLLLKAFNHPNIYNKFIAVARPLPPEIASLINKEE